MPDASGLLTEDDKKKIVDWLRNTSWGLDAKCPICGDTNWAIGEYLVQPVTLGAGGGLQLGGTGYPQIQIISTRCGYTIFLNAVIVGILPGKREGIPT
jgi:predicted nucleic-acid-binding Zn-ribbon protein